MVIAKYKDHGGMDFWFEMAPGWVIYAENEAEAEIIFEAQKTGNYTNGSTNIAEIKRKYGPLIKVPTRKSH